MTFSNQGATLKTVLLNMNLVVSLVLLTICWISIVLSEELAKKRVLSFGGNGMIGSAVLHRYIINNYKFTVIEKWHKAKFIRIQ